MQPVLAFLGKGFVFAGLNRAMPGGKQVIVADAAGFAVADNRLGTAVGRDDGGNAAGQRLKHHIAERVGVRGEDEQVHVGVGRGKRFPAQARRRTRRAAIRSRSHASSPPWPTMRKRKLLCPIASNSSCTRPAAPHSSRRRADPQSPARDRGHRARAAFAGMNSSASTPRGIRWQGRPVARSSSAQSSGLGAKAPAPWSRTWPRRPGSDPRWSARWQRLRGSRRTNQSDRRARYSCTLVCQLAASGSAFHMRQPAPSMPTSLGPVMWIRSGWKRSSTSPIRECGAEMRGRSAGLFPGQRRESRAAARGSRRCRLRNGLGAVAGADAEKGQIAPPRESLKVAAGVGHPVHFMEGVGESRRRAVCMRLVGVIR
jgi:hypothetical protein